MRLTPEEKAEIVSILEWYLEEEADKDWRAYVKKLIHKLEN